MRRFFTKVEHGRDRASEPGARGRDEEDQHRVASNPNPQAVQKAMSRLTPAERRAYMEAAQEQGAVPESANRQMRRQAERMQQQARGGRPGGGSGSARKRKRRASYPRPVGREPQLPVLADGRRRRELDLRRPAGARRDAEPVRRRLARPHHRLADARDVRREARGRDGDASRP